MSQTHFMFRIDIGFNTEKGYGATVLDVKLNRIKGIKAASPEQLISRIRNVFLEEIRKKRDFPLEMERNIITPEEFGHGS
jgi:hypothetical protein